MRWQWTTSQMETCSRYQISLSVGRDNEHCHSAWCVSHPSSDLTGKTSVQPRRVEHMRFLLWLSNHHQGKAKNNIDIIIKIGRATESLYSSPKRTYPGVKQLTLCWSILSPAEPNGFQRSGGIKSMQSIATLYPVGFINHFRSSISITVIRQMVMDTGNWICTQRFVAMLLGLRPWK